MSYILFFSGQDRIRTCMSSYLVVPKCVSYSKTTSLKKLLASTIPPPDHLKTDLKRRIILLIILRDGKRGSVFIFKELICSQDRIRTCIISRSYNHTTDCRGCLPKMYVRLLIPPPDYFYKQ